jgi:hypothetical protein
MLSIFDLRVKQTLLREDQALFGTFYTAKSRYLTCTTLHAAAINPHKPDWAASRPSIINLNAHALLILNTTGLSLKCELPQISLGHQMA